MISSIHKTRPARAGGRRARAGFTLVELMAVIGIIVLLTSILVPSITRAVRAAQRTRMQYDLQSIATALESYKHDHHEYPRVARGSGLGANILARALIGPAPTLPITGDKDFDGAEGPGFRTRSAVADGSGGFVQQGKVWGPYLPPDQFRPVQIPFTGPTDLHWVIMDRKDVPILYFPVHRGTNINAASGYVDDSSTSSNINPMFDLADNAPGAPPFSGGYYLDAGGNKLSLKAFQLMMGADTTNGKALNPQYVVQTDGFALLSAGPDQLWGPKRLDIPLDIHNRADDVTNFNRTETNER
jgi:prepilin-type N-terminal cleavage/methylation domain-containing protein